MSDAAPPQARGRVQVSEGTRVLPADDLRVHSWTTEVWGLAIQSGDGREARYNSFRSMMSASRRALSRTVRSCVSKSTPTRPNRAEYPSAHS